MSRKHRLTELLSNELQHDFLLIELEDESANHGREKIETHFRLIIVSNQFNNLSKINRHRWVNQLVAEEFNQGLHALSMHLYTPVEWQAQQEKQIPSPACRGGSRYDA